MDRQNTLQTPIDGVTKVIPEKVDWPLLANAKASTVHYSQNDQKPTGAMKHYGRRMKLHCEHDYNLLIFGNQTVSTSDDDIDKHCIMEFTSVAIGHVRIRGVEANLFLAMNKYGLLYGEPDPTNKATIFIEQADGPYSAYLSLKYKRKNWYIAIKKNGKIKLGPRTKRGQKATHFLTIAVD